MITAAVGMLGAGAVSAAEFEAAELYVPAVGLKQSMHSGSDEEKFQAELTLEVSGLKELYKKEYENTESGECTVGRQKKRMYHADGERRCGISGNSMEYKAETGDTESGFREYSV